MIEDTTSNKDEVNELNLKDQLNNYLSHWKWFLLSIILCSLFIFLKLNFTRELYKASTTILIKNDNGGKDSKLSAFQDLGILAKNRDGIEDEMEILKSKDLISEVIKSLDMNIRFYTDKNQISALLDDNFSTETDFFEIERYLYPPLKINFFSNDSLISRRGSQFKISIISDIEFTYKDKFKSFKSAFGEKITTKELGDIIITPNFSSKSVLIGTDILVKMTPIRGLANSYASALQIEPRGDFSNIVDVTFNNTVREKAIDFLDQLIKKYNERSVIQKELLTKSSSDFVDKRLAIIESELSDIDITAEKFKTSNRISNVASEAGYNIQSTNEIEKQIVSAETQLQKIEFMKELVSEKNESELIPELDIGDNNVLAFQQQYNELMIEKNRLLKTSTEKNPTVVNISEQLNSIKANFNNSLNSIESAQKISLNALNQQDKRINSRLYSAPKQERQLRTISRQQQIKEALFLYLLQKREEIAITLGVSEPNAKIIDQAVSSTSPISPNKKVSYLAAFFIGLLIPFGIIYIKDFLDTKIKSREEIEKLLNIPILGDIPKLVTKKRFLITENDHSSIAEAFRILRTNLSFLLTNTNDKGKTIFITSTIASEGKSLVSSNLAAALAFAGKKTLLIGMDIRAPKIKEYIGIKGNIGVTNYIIDTNLSINEITLKVPKVKNLNLISSGSIPPNPAELLMNPRVKELFDSIKMEYEYIIVDTAASSIITDTMLLKDFADAFIYVIRANYLDKRQLGYLKSVYENKRFPNMALLVNAVDHKKGYGYGYGYGSEFEATKNKSWWKLKLNRKKTS
jgi:capsular exopolysaccharide synthesis family protein